MNNPFDELEPEDKVPEGLKKALVSEIDTIRDTMELVTLYVGHFFNAAGAIVNQNSPKSDTL
ncbi:MAG: hypothetical protein MUE30_19115 [Spirosomaceae bacterium]|jgi:hypothetical protein|nr:hypothetical protein [Spirosomataceae bacterium]